ncbi:MAG: DUF885 family protein [Phycisphaerae bacterium]|nr:DUF885 family protein [Phycisphaerae bacterium]
MPTALFLAVGLILPCAMPVLFEPLIPAGTADDDCPDVGSMLAEPRSELVIAIERFEADRGALLRKYPLDLSPRRRERMEQFYDGWLAALAPIDVKSLSRDAQVDWILLRNEIRHERHRLDTEAAAFVEYSSLLPFAMDIVALAETREAIPPYPPAKAADDLIAIAAKANDADRALRDAIDRADETHPRPSPSVCRRGLIALEESRRELRNWQAFRSGYDPEFGWWVDAPYAKADSALDGYAKSLRERGVGQTPDKPDVIVGTPIGRDALIADLGFEMIPYTPEEIIAIGERELAWCETKLKQAAAEMNCGDDWKKALELVKRDFVGPGEQPALIRDLALEAAAFLKTNELVTVPPLAMETWRMEMMSPQRQMVTPFFTGGEVISVSFPAASMAHDLKLMSLRGNNRHFARATVFHELVPGHHLQQFAESRWKPYRGLFSTPFWTEGWALHWEMLMWDKGFPRTAEEKMGMLFWRTHRAARIIFSMKYQLGQMTAQECIDFLVDRVGHERANAEGEVRRSVSGDYAPLYQAAYMLGGLQFRALHHELVDGGTMTDRQFHDTILHQHNMPVELVRAILRGDALTNDFHTAWRFDEELDAVREKK